MILSKISDIYFNNRGVKSINSFENMAFVKYPSNFKSKQGFIKNEFLFLFNYQEDDKIKECIDKFDRINTKISYSGKGWDIYRSNTRTAFKNIDINDDARIYIANLSDLITLKTKGIPSYLYSITGLHSAESWGRWSISDKVIFNFTESLPTSFNVNFSGSAFGPNVGEMLDISIGETKKSMKMNKTSSFYSVAFSNVPKNTYSIIFKIPKPSSPFELNQGLDERKIGFGFETFQIKL